MELTDGCYSEGIPRGCQGSFTPVSLGYPLSVFNKNSTLKCVDSAGTETCFSLPVSDLSLISEV